MFILRAIASAVTFSLMFARTHDKEFGEPWTSFISHGPLDELLLSALPMRLCNKPPSHGVSYCDAVVSTNGTAIRGSL
jgi:hypothetical protein